MGRYLALAMILALAIALTACGKKATVEIGDESEVLNGSPEAIAPQATDAIAEQPAAEPVPEPAPAPASIPEPAPPPAPTTQQLVQETEQLVEESRRKLPDFEPDVFVHFIDVGYGDATLVQAGSKNVLVDCGSYGMGRAVADYLSLAGVERLDALVVTSPDKEHVGGCDYVLQYFPVDRLYDNGLDGESEEYKLFMASVEDLRVNRISLHEPADLDLGEGTRGRVITPYHGRNFISNTKDNSLLFRLDHGRTSVLVASDCRKGCERELLEYYGPAELQATVLRVGDHGGADAATELFLDAVLPEAGVISTLEDMAADLPSRDLLARLRKYGATVFRTDYDGHVLFKSDGEAYAFYISRGVAHIDPSGQQNLTFTPYNDCPITAHRFGNVYYPIDCVYAHNIEPENRECYASADEAAELGLTLYSKC